MPNMRNADEAVASDLRGSRFSRILENFFEISLLDLDLESFLFHFHFSISISSHFHFTFISRSRSQVKKIHLHFLKRVNGIFSLLFTSRLSKTHSRRTLTYSFVVNFLDMIHEANRMGVTLDKHQPKPLDKPTRPNPTKLKASTKILAPKGLMAG